MSKVGFAVGKKPTKKARINFKKRFLNKIRSIFVEHKFKLIPLEREVRFKDKMYKTETLQIDKVQLPMSWSPKLEDMRSEDMYGALLRDCVASIQELLNDDNSSEGKML